VSAPVLFWRILRGLWAFFQRVTITSILLWRIVMTLNAIPCPHCRRPAPWVDNAHRPFCSERCRLIDLGAWIDENYRVPDAILSPNADEEEKHL